MANLPPRTQGVVPYLSYKNGKGAIDFLAKAFGFEVRGVLPGPGQSVMHAELGVGKSAVMLGAASEQFGFKSPSELPARHAGVWCYVDDADAHCAHARASGATIVREPCDQFYGVREYTARDLEGQEWFFATPLAGAVAPQRKKKPARSAKASAKARSGPAAKK